MKQSLILLVAISLLGTRCSEHSNQKISSKAQPVAGETITAVFYNIENLFDTVDDPKTLDDDFTPGGKLGWTDERYQNHLDHSARVLAAMDVDQPELIGLCEIENRQVLDDLVKTGELANTGYEIIHKDSPDERGIDVALLFDKNTFLLLNSEFIFVTLPATADPNTRDVLYAELKSGEETIHVFVNHWPSRREGEKESEPNRIAVAEIVKTKVDEILSNDAKAKILLMGDFNDYPDNRSISEILDASTTSGSAFFNLMAEKQMQGDGSYWYKDAWGCLDQFMVSQSMLDSENGWSASTNSAFIFRDEFILFTDSKGNKRPNRIYAGDDYKGGYSDHLPVYLTLVWK